VEIEDQQYPCSNKDWLSVRLIQAGLIPSYLPLLAEKQATIILCLLSYVVGCVHKMAKLDMSMEAKITYSKIFIFQPILEFQKHFHYTEANAVSSLLFSDRTICEIRFFKFSQEG
jgi:hypothetical protein